MRILIAYFEDWTTQHIMKRTYIQLGFDKWTHNNLIKRNIVSFNATKYIPNDCT